MFAWADVIGPTRVTVLTAQRDLASLVQHGVLRWSGPPSWLPWHPRSSPTTRATPSKVFSIRTGVAMTTELVAFLDESRKPLRDPATRRVDEYARKHYVVAAAVVIDGDSPNIRRQLERVEAEIGYPLHYQDLSTARRVEALEAIDGIGGWDGYLYETARALPDAGHSEHHVRAKVIERALTHLSSEGVVKATLETRAGTNRRFLPLDDKDQDVVRKLQRQRAIPGGFRISHDDKTEAILQIADLLAGARSDNLCRVNRETFWRVSHRVCSIHTVFDKAP